MTNIPKVVRERLEAATPAVNHPDADLLTAFAERSLPELERAIVMEHLARCGDCRDILALSVPASEPLEAGTSSVRGQWLGLPGLSWPTVRWAFVAAGIVAIVSVGVVQFQLRERSTMAKKQAISLQSTDTEANNLTTSPPMAGAPAAKGEEGKGKDVSPPAVFDSLTRSAAPAENRKRAESPQAGSPAPVITGAVGGQLSTGPKMPDQWQQRQNANAFQGKSVGGPISAPALAFPPAPPPPSPNAKQQAEGDRSANFGVPAASQTVEVSGAAAAINTQQEALDARVQDKPAPPQDADEAVGKAKPPVKVEAQAAAPPIPMVSSTPAEMSAGRNQGVNGRNTSQLAAAQSSSTTFRWTVNPEGGLERSVDRGNSWQGVDVNAASSNDSMRYAVSKTARAKDKSDEKKQSAATPIFRAVAAMGAEVWAGGSGGALYHSSDGGNHWTRVVPSATGEILKGDVVALEFSDSMHGKVTTSIPEVWTTADGGQTWQKQ